MSDDFDDDIKRILARDPLQEVENGLHKLPDPILEERVAKEGELDDRDTFRTKANVEETLNHAIHVNTLKRAAMIVSGDTIHGDKILRYLALAEEIGFKTILEVPFTVKSFYDEKPRNEKFFVMWREDGILLVFDTYGETGINGGNFYYNWSFKDEADRRGVTSTGEWFDMNTWIGSHDCREGLKFHIRQLEKNGSFMPKWVKRPFLWLLHHGDTANDAKYDYEAINKERIALLPAEVQKAIGT